LGNGGAGLSPEAFEVATPRGPARVHLQPVDGADLALVLGHGAGGGVEASDLVASARAAHELGVGVALVEQPYRVAGRRSQPPAAQLDSAWLAVIAVLREGALSGARLVTGGRSAGARVACRTAAEAEAVAVLCLAFPLHPPGRAGDPSKSRLPELQAVRVPVLVVQGASDPFGMPPDGRRRKVVRVPGNHSLRSTDAVEAAVGPWLQRLLK
jgi:hypothetical protein